MRLPLARRTNESAHAYWALGLLVSLIALVGCEQAPPPVPASPKLSPEQKLEVIIGRLDDLIKDTTSDTGLIVKREISHRFLPAKVSAEDSDQLAKRVPKGEISVVTKRFISFRSGENPITGELPVDAEIQPILHRSESETRKYNLTYRNDRWQLETELTDESEKVWFKYALAPPH